MGGAFRFVARVFGALGILALCCAIILFILTSWKAPLHEFNLWVLKSHFGEVEHPADSKSLRKLSGFGNLFRAASNGCDYLVGELRVGSGPQGKIARHYQDIFVRPFDDTEAIPVEIKFFDDEEFSEDFLWSRLWFDWREKIRTSFDWTKIEGTPYVVFARQTDYSPDTDIRCFYEPAIR